MIRSGRAWTLGQTLSTGLCIRPSEVNSLLNSLSLDETKDPFPAERGAARTQFQHLVSKECPTVRWGNKACKGGCGPSSDAAGAKRRKAKDGR